MQEFIYRLAAERPKRPSTYDMYDVSVGELKALREYAETREQLRNEFRKKVSDPYSRAHKGWLVSMSWSCFDEHDRLITMIIGSFDKDEMNLHNHELVRIIKVVSNLHICRSFESQY